MNPRARHAELETQTVDGELVVYDLRNDHAHSLHSVTARVRELSDGTRSVADIHAELASDGIELAEVWSALDALADADLLEERIAPPTSERTVSRRKMIRNLAAASAAGAFAVGLRSVVAPTPLQAQSGYDAELQEKAEFCETLDAGPTEVNCKESVQKEAAKS